MSPITTPVSVLNTIRTLAKRTPIIGIYKITSPSGRIYIGQSINIHKRWKVYKRFNPVAPLLDAEGEPIEPKQTILYRSFKKYGVGNHTFEVIRICEPIELNILEVYYIAAHNSFNSNHGLNATSGGDSHYQCSDETKLKITLSRIGDKNPMWGKHPSAETIEKRSNSLKKLERKLTPEHIEKMQVARINAGPYHHTDEAKIKIGEAITGEKHWNFGKKASQETIDKMKSHNGEKSHLFGTHNSEETKAKKKLYSENRTIEHRHNLSLSQLGKKASLETRKKQSEAKKGENNVLYKQYGILNQHSKKVVQIDAITDKPIKVWDAMSDVSRALGIFKTNISSVCRGRAITAGGFKWEYFISEAA